jgi:crotonobetainyl-CoA:carnitine CoA-transferase CaiB-like acyl-CoA transferase
LRAVFFAAYNRNKRSVAIDLKSGEGRGLVHRLAATADVVLENFAPGTMERLGCGHAELAARNPRLIHCALKGFLAGPYEHRPALDEVVQFMAGLAYMTGPPGQPLRAGSSLIDIMGGMFAVIAVQAALAERARTGRGQFVKSALFETAAFVMTQHMAGQATTGREPPPMPAREPAWAIYDLFATADKKQIFIGITSDGHWRRFCEHFARDDLLRDPQFATNEDRVRQRETIRPIVADIARQHTVAQLAELFDRIGIPFSPVAKPGGLFDDPQLNAQKRMLDIEFGNGARARMPALRSRSASFGWGCAARRRPSASTRSRCSASWVWKRPRSTRSAGGESLRCRRRSRRVGKGVARRKAREPCRRGQVQARGHGSRKAVAFAHPTEKFTVS